jgi:hypothetical protein
MSKPSITLGLVLFCAMGARAQGALEMQPAVRLPHAGLVAAMPAGFDSRPPTQMFDVLRAVRSNNDLTVQGITVSVFPVDEEITADQFTESMIKEWARNLAVQDLTVAKRTHIRVAGKEGTARRVTYEYRGKKTVAVCVCFLRKAGQGGRTCCMVTVESLADRSASLLPVLGGVLKSIRLIPFKHPAEVPVGSQGHQWEHPELDLSLGVPVGWHVREMPGGVSLGMIDYLRAGVPTVSAQLTLTPAPPGEDPNDACRAQLERARRFAAQNAMSAEVVSQGQAVLAGIDGCQFILAQKPNADAATEAAAGAAELFVAHRIARVPPSEANGRQTRQCTLTVVCQGGSADATAKTIEALAGRARLGPSPSTQPAESSFDPATRP